MTRFENDEAVDLDCGCTAYPDDNYFVVHVPVWNIAKSKYEIKELTYCGDNECLFNILDGHLRIDTEHIKTAYDKEQEYEDYMADEAYDAWKDDGI